MNLELGHQIGTMAFDVSLVNREVGGDLLVQLTAQDVGQYFLIARSEPGEANLQFALAEALLALELVTPQRAPHGGNQIFFGSGFGQEILRAAAHGSDAGRNVSLSAEENDRQGIGGIGERLL